MSLFELRKTNEIGEDCSIIEGMCFPYVMYEFSNIEINWFYAYPSGISSQSINEQLYLSLEDMRRICDKCGFNLYPIYPDFSNYKRYPSPRLQVIPPNANKIGNLCKTLEAENTKIAQKIQEKWDESHKIKVKNLEMITRCTKEIESLNLNDVYCGKRGDN